MKYTLFINDEYVGISDSLDEWKELLNILGIPIPNNWDGTCFYFQNNSGSEQAFNSCVVRKAY